MAKSHTHSLKPRPTENDYFRWPAVQVVQQERAGAEGRCVLTGQRRIGAEENTGMIWVNRPPHLHHDPVAALRLVAPIEAGGLVVRFIQAGVVLVLPPAIGALEGFEL